MSNNYSGSSTEKMKFQPKLEDSDDVWEDIVDPIRRENRPPLPMTPSPTGSVTSMVRSSPRKRKTIRRSTCVTTLPRKQAAPVTLKHVRPLQKAIATQEILDGAVNGTSFVARYLFDIISTAVGLLRRPLYLIVFIWMLATIISLISQTVRQAFAPLCYLPGLYSSSLCRPLDAFKKGQGGLPRWADYPKLIDVQTTTFEHLLDESVGNSGLSLEIKRAEMATTDLVTLVRVSDLHSRDTLGDALVEFIGDTKTTGRNLQKLTSRIGGAVDKIMAINDYALYAIEEAQAKAPSRFSIKGLVPWAVPRPTSEIVTETFSSAMSVLSEEMTKVILEAEANIIQLDRLEDRLSTVHEILTREDSTLTSARADLLADLWTKLGGNKKTLRGFDNHLLLLKNLGVYRKKALVHVAAALQTLQGMSADMDDIRERVAAPELTRSKIPVEVHMKSIRSGLERLKEGKVRARRLEEQAIRRVLEVGSDETTD
ncbi:hypothetical protein BDZ94DRAFT_1295755 [Collybia nuda]|uniref:Uncharacterized protein n=1 Tax=Collybia nuda TaxID=64659 RepID=A0A9P5YF10_9AGAR|nr:hypothetical protein BDZ94DRAFT_1295755 [Collybia nuda]